jgi:GMP synthase (glutamine-hydrolysing)
MRTGYRTGGIPAAIHVFMPTSLPQSVEGIDLLVVFGGPQSPKTTTDECPHFNAAAERALISKCVTAGRAVVGICLGSQLVGEALGAKHDKSPEKEIGTFPIILTAEGKANDKFSDFGDTLDVGHWHNDMPGLTKDATIIAYSQGCSASHRGHSFQA